MEVVERVGGPFSRRNVQEWSRLDQLTGLLEHARVETDHWTASTSNSSHHFGKVTTTLVSLRSVVFSSSFIEKDKYVRQFYKQWKANVRVVELGQLTIQHFIKINYIFKWFYRAWSEMSILNQWKSVWKRILNTVVEMSNLKQVL